MPSLIDMRRRIRSVRNTQQITKAMKMVSAAKLRRAQDKAIAARPYAAMLQQILANVADAAAQSPDSGDNALLAVRPEKRILMLVISADRGLAGGFNGNLLRMALRFAQAHPTEELSFELAGKKARDFFRKRNVRITGEYIDLFRAVKFEDAERIADSIIDRYAKAEIDAVYLFVNEFKSVMASNLATSKLLPLEVPKASHATPVSHGAGPAQTADYIYEQSPGEILATLLPRYIKTQVYRALLESAAAEHAARMTAMEAATKNASEMIDKLTLTMNRVRQASITREIIEIVSGAAAL
jgi:F-type H+-transporting ATPase subunit gamma